MHRSLLLAGVLLLFACSTAHAQRASTSPLSIEQIMQDPSTWVGDWPENVRWHENGETLYFDWNPEGQFQSDSLYRVPRAGGSPQKVAPSERRAGVPTFDGWRHGAHVYSPDRRHKVYAHDGDLYRYDRRRDAVTRLTDTRDAESNPRFDPSGDRVVFERDATLYALTLATGLVRQLTDLRPGEEPADPEPTPQERFLEEQQTTLFETIREAQKETQAEEAAAKRDRQADDPPPTVYTGDASVEQLQIDPTERYVSFVLLSEPAQDVSTKVVDYVTASGFADVLSARPKVGIEPDDATLHVQDLQRDTTFAVDLHQLPGAYDVPAYRQDQGVDLDSTEAKRSLYSYGPFWSPSGAHAVLVVRADDNKDRWIVRLDPSDGTLTVLDRQHDAAWIGGPGIGAYGGPGTVGWMPDGDRFYFQSEATGTSHLYAVDVASGAVQALTSGDFVVREVHLSRDGSTWTVLANADTPHEWHVYRMNADGSNWRRLTARGASHTLAVSPDGTRLGTLRGRTDHPPEVHLQDARSGADATRVTESTTDAWTAYDWRAPEIVTFEASDGVDVPVEIFRPDAPNGAAVHFVHGAGYIQNVVNDWTYYFREYMFHNLLADQGYLVVNVDYRGSAGYGRDWRTAIYRHMGGRDLQDYVDASAWLQDTEGIDPERQFIYGGSYGGFLTLMALFTAPDRFGGGAALRSVTDWAHYNDVYTANILNTPATDSLAYARSSPIYFADGLEDPLLMPHGLIDTNVQPQDIFRLTQRLIELGKTDWELALYPVEAHSFEQPSSWTDEYRRIHALIERTVGPRRSAPADASEAPEAMGGGR